MQLSSKINKLTPPTLSVILLFTIAVLVLHRFLAPLFATDGASGQCPDGWTYKVEHPPFKLSSAVSVCRVGIKSGNSCFPYENSGDDCYQINGINTTNLSVSKIGVGKGQYCQDISHVVYYPCPVGNTPTITPSAPTDTPVITPTPTRSCSKPTVTPTLPQVVPTATLTNTPTTSPQPSLTPTPTPTAVPEVTQTPTSPPTTVSQPTQTPTQTPYPTSTPIPAPTDTSVNPSPAPTSQPTSPPAPTSTPVSFSPSPQGIGGVPEDNFNPLIEGIKESFEGSVLGESTMPPTADTNPAAGKLPTDNVLIPDSRLVVPKLKLDHPLSRSASLGGDLLVGHKEILVKDLGKTKLFYAHNGTDLFGSLYTLRPDDDILLVGLSDSSFTVSRIAYISQNQSLDSLNTGDAIVLVTCSWTNPDLRIVVFANPKQ